MRRPSNNSRLDILFAAALLLLVAGHFWFPTFGGGTGRDTYSYGNEGKNALFRVVQSVQRAEGNVAKRNTEPLIRILSDINEFDNSRPTRLICLLGPARYPNVAEWDKLLKWVERGGRLLLAANDQKPEFNIEKLKLKVRRIDEIDADGDQIETALVQRGMIVWQSQARIIATSSAEQLLSANGTTQVIRQRHGSGSVVVVASDFIFSNQSLKFVEGNALLAMRLIDRAAGGGDREKEIVFDEALNMSGTPKVVGLLLNPAFKPVTIQLLIAIVLFAWWGSRRFGPLLPEATAARQNIVDHTDAVGNLLYKTGDGTSALRAYIRQLFAELKMKMHRGREERVIEPLAYKLGKDPELITRLLQRAVKATKQKHVDRREAAHLLRQLSVIRRASQQKAVPRRRRKVQSPPPLKPA